MRAGIDGFVRIPKPITEYYPETGLKKTIGLVRENELSIFLQ